MMRKCKWCGRELADYEIGECRACTHKKPAVKQFGIVRDQIREKLGMYPVVDADDIPAFIEHIEYCIDCCIPIDDERRQLYYKLTENTKDSNTCSVVL